VAWFLGEEGLITLFNLGDYFQGIFSFFIFVTLIYTFRDLILGLRGREIPVEILSCPLKKGRNNHVKLDCA